MGPSYKTKIKEKRGEGRGKDYKPWIQVGEFSGKGNNRRIYGFKTGREHHFLSKFEASLFFIFDLEDTIEDIREQFPLLDIELAKEIAEEAGIEYPDEEHILTSDYCLTYTDGREEILTIKHLEDMTERQLELFEIERRYWKEKEVPWKIVTEKDMPVIDLLKNFENIHSAIRRFNFDSYSNTQIQELYSYIYENYENSSDLSITEFAKAIDSELENKPGFTLWFIKVLIARGMISTDLTKPLASSKRKMKDLNFKIKDARNITKSDLAA